VGGGPSFGLYHFHSFFLKECCLFSRCLSVRCGYCGWRFCDCWFFEGRWYCE